MSATGRTPNYNLAVYREFDITSYLIDFNGNMEAIDTAMKAISDAVTGGDETIGAASDHQFYSPNANITVRNNWSGSTTALATLPSVVPATYNFSGFVEADCSALPDTEPALLTINLDGRPTSYSMELYKDEATRQYTFSVPLKIAQKGSITLEATIQSHTNSSVLFKQVAIVAQKLNV